jgi:hypothetical protein
LTIFADLVLTGVIISSFIFFIICKVLLKWLLTRG